MEKRIEIHKDFMKHYDQRIRHSKQLKQRYLERLQMFRNDRSNSILKDHSLRGRRQGERSFSITGDFRVVYIEYEDHFLFLDVGTHNQVY